MKKTYIAPETLSVRIQIDNLLTATSAGFGNPTDIQYGKEEDDDKYFGW
ncbi:MAG: hypothetical protein Q4F34_09070 [Prevotellaceae bacterium]|nr:hypothetical protein [Prevotellaceae bacterium]